MLRDFPVKKVKKTGLNGCIYKFCDAYKTFDTGDFIDIHKYLLKETKYKIMLGLIKKIFIALSS